MSALPNSPFTSVDSTRVAVDAPASTDLFTDMCVDLNYLKSVTTGGAGAVAPLNAADGSTINGNLTVTGGLTVGTFTIPETALIYLAL